MNNQFYLLSTLLISFLLNYIQNTLDTLNYLLYLLYLVRSDYLFHFLNIQNLTLIEKKITGDKLEKEFDKKSSLSKNTINKLNLCFHIGLSPP